MYNVCIRTVKDNWYMLADVGEVPHGDVHAAASHPLPGVWIVDGGACVCFACFLYSYACASLGGFLGSSAEHSRMASERGFERRADSRDLRWSNRDE